jgi:hypothetical protein
MDNLNGLDTSQRFLEATTHTVAWFWNRLRNDELQMKPPFQRNPVWQEVQKAYLIDTIIRGYPVPELYLQTTVSAEGKEQHIIVDGQQRVRACLEFVNNDFALGEQSGGLAGFLFEQVSDEIKRRIFEYKFVVRSLPILPDAEVREIFGRLNRNNVALNRQELRHATYWGEFILMHGKPEPESLLGYVGRFYEQRYSKDARHRICQRTSRCNPVWPTEQEDKS